MVVPFKTQIVSTQDYYPFGLTFNESVRVASSPQQYLYNGKESIDEWGVIDYGARMYMPELGRWNGVDPMTETYYEHSPYNYTTNNPINLIDIDGALTYDWESGTYKDDDGNEVSNDDAMSQLSEASESVYQSDDCCGGVQSGMEEMHGGNPDEIDRSESNTSHPGQRTWFNDAYDGFMDFAKSGLSYTGFGSIWLAMFESSSDAELAAAGLLAVIPGGGKGKKTDFLFKGRNDALNWARNKLGHSASKVYDKSGKWVGWKNKAGDMVYWGHGDWGKGVGSSTFPHLNYQIGGQKGHLFLKDKIVNKGMWDNFADYFKEAMTGGL